LHGGFVWDDDTYISENPTLRSWPGLWAIWSDPSATCQYYPLSFTFFWTIYRFFGLNPIGYHLATLLLHGVAAILFWQVLERLRVRGALLAGAIFAFHPVNVMSVAWMTELKNTLSCSLALGAGWAYVRFAGLGVYGHGAREKKWRWYGLSLALFLLAMLAKTAVSFLPVTLLLVVWWQRERMTRRDLLSLLPMAGISVGMGALTIYIERHAGGAYGTEFNIGFVDRVLISGRSFWFYLGKLAWPSPLIFIYPRWKVDAGVWWQWIYPAAAVAALAGTWMARGRLGKAVFAALMHFYVSTSMLVLAVILYMMRYSFVSDHWVYFGSLSIIALAASGFTQAMDRMGKLWGKPLEAGLGITLILGLAFLTWAQSGMYSDTETLWRTTISRNPDCAMAYNNLGEELHRRRQIDQAISDFLKGIHIKPEDPDIHNNLGYALFTEGRVEEAVAEYREAIRLSPDHEGAHYNLANALVGQGRIEEGIAEFRETLRIDPAFAVAHNNLGDALLHQGRLDEAMAEFREALRIDSTQAPAHQNLGIVLLRLGRREEAIAEFRETVRLDPGFTAAYDYLGSILNRQGRAGEAISEFRTALRANPGDADTHNNLGVVLLQQRQPEQAISEFREAMRLNPDYAMARYNLGTALFDKGDAAEAIAQARRALDLRPSDPAIQNSLAWMLATAPQSSLRDGSRAVQLATKAVQSDGGGNPETLRTLAAALAQGGRFPEAVQTARKALQVATTRSNATLAGALEKEIALYGAHHTYEEAH